MDRRRFLRLLGAALLGAGFCDPAFVPPAEAVVPVAAALAIFNTALNVAQLFDSGGKGLADLLEQQVYMLRAISEQLATIQHGIVEILNSLEEVKSLIGAIPTDVVEEMHRAKIAGLLTIYSTSMKTYFADERDQGVAFAQTNNIPALETNVIAPLYRSVAILTGYPATGMIPIVCAASFVHSEAMILANYRRNAMLPVLQVYVDWLTTMTQVLSAEIKLRQTKLTDLQAKLHVDDVYDCRLTANSGLARFPIMFATFKTVHAKTVYAAADPEIQIAADEMIAKKIMPVDERPAKITLALDDVTPSSQAIVTGAGVQKPKGKSPTWFREMLNNPCPDAQTARQHVIDSLSPQFDEITLQLMARRALNHAANTALASLIERTKAIEKLSE